MFVVGQHVRHEVPIGDPRRTKPQRVIIVSKTLNAPPVQVNLDMTDSMGPGKLVRHMQNPSYTYDEYLIYIGLGPSISPVKCKNLSYDGPSYPCSPVQQTGKCSEQKLRKSIEGVYIFRFDYLSSVNILHIIEKTFDQKKPLRSKSEHILQHDR